MMDLVTNPLFLMSVAIVSGLLLGEVSIRRFKLGVSGTLFTGMALSWAVYHWVASPYVTSYAQDPASVPSYVARILQGGLVDKAYFNLLLVLFVASVGLQAAPNVAKVFRGHGIRFLFLAVVITTSGAGIAYSLFRLIPGLDHMAVAGVYTGALTSSPGLGVALETVSKLFTDSGSAAARAAQASVGLGYAAAYPFSVVTVITGMQLLPRIFKINIDQEKERLREELTGDTVEEHVIPTVGGLGIDFPAFMLVCIVGSIVGKFALPLGQVGKISLETTGGVLVSALILGSKGKIGPFNFHMEERALGVIKQFALLYFLAYVGLNYGYQAVGAMAGPNVMLVLVGIITTSSTLLIGFLFGRYVLKMNWILLAGGICGGMTSTPGLGAAIDSTGSNEVAGGYGSTYPLGLLCKVILVLLLYKLPM